MAFAMTLWLSLVFLKECLGNNNSSYNGTFSSTSSDGSTVSAELLRVSTSSSLLSTLHPVLNTDISPSSVLQSLSSVTVLQQDNGTSETKVSSIAVTSSQGAGTSVAYSSRQSATLNKTKSLAHSLVSMNLSFSSNDSTTFVEKTSSVHISSSVVGLRSPKGSNKIFVVEMRVFSINFTSEMQNKSSPVFLTAALAITNSVDFVMKGDRYYKDCRVTQIRQKGEAYLEITMSPGSSSDPTTALQLLRTAVKSGYVGNLTVDPNVFSAVLKKNPPARERLLPGQLAGVALILFILVVLLLIICLGNFADVPVFNERELFTEEVNMENLRKDEDNQGQQEDDEDWKFDPLFAWSPRRSFDSKL